MKKAKRAIKGILSKFHPILPLKFKADYLSLPNTVVHHQIGNFKVFAKSYGNLFILKKEIFDNQEYKFVAKTDRPKIIDCGANTGVAVLYFKSLYPKASIIAFEPNPFACEMLVKNVKENGLDNVSVHNTCLSNTIGEVDFYISENVNTLRGSMMAERGGNNKMAVKSVLLSSIVKDQNFDLVKMDVEGAEWNILEDLINENCIGNVDRYLIEYHHAINNERSRLSEFLRKFEENGFDYSIRTNYKRVGQFQDVFLDIYKRINKD